MNFLFLDIDGVLNGYYTKGLVAGYCFLEEEKLPLLKEFVERNDLKIVLSSTWRYGYYYEKRAEEDETFVISHKMARDIILYHALVDKFKEYELEIYDHTEITDEDKYDRGLEIKAYLEKHTDEVEKVIILDDISNVRPVGRFFVRTSMVEGLTEKHIAKAERLLKEQVEGKVVPWASQK